MNNQFFTKNLDSTNNIISNEVSIEFYGTLFNSDSDLICKSNDLKKSVALYLTKIFFDKVFSMSLINRAEADDIKFIVEDFLEKSNNNTDFNFNVFGQNLYDEDEYFFPEEVA